MRRTNAEIQAATAFPTISGLMTSRGIQRYESDDHVGRQSLIVQLIRLMLCRSKTDSDLFGVFRSSIQRESGCGVDSFLMVFGNYAFWISYLC